MAAADTPRGRILVVEDQAIIALDCSVSCAAPATGSVGPAGQIEEVRRLVSQALDGAVIDLDHQKDGPPAADLLAETGIPFVLVTSSRDTVPAQHAAQKGVEKLYVPNELLNAIRSAEADAAVSTGRDIVYPVAPPLSFPRSPASAIGRLCTYWVLP